MTWQEKTVTDEKRRFIAAVMSGCELNGQRVSFSALCITFGISRKTGYKYLHRYTAEGEDGLQERSRAPYCPQRITSDLQDRLLKAHDKHRDMGPVKLRQWLERRYPDTVWPVASTISRYLGQAERTVASAPRAIRVDGGILTVAEAANDVWGTDFKGWCLTGDGTHCEPWTLLDLSSRYLLGCVGMLSISTASVLSGFEAAFHTYGLPAVIRTDNGNPFVSSTRFGLSRLTVWWLKLGIRHERIKSGCPQQNGRLERFHRTLKAGTMRPPAETLEAQQAVFDRYAVYYNEERPHASLDGLPPAVVYVASRRPYRPVPDDFTFSYPVGWEVRRVRSNGEVKWAGVRHFVSEALIGEMLGYRPLNGKYWGVYLGQLALAVWEPSRSRYLPKRQAAPRPG